jgi:hypothetical protein
MKKAYLLLVLTSCLFFSCKLSNLPYDAKDIEEIKLGTGMKENRKDAVILQDDESIHIFISEFTFAGERAYTVKHPLSAYVEFHLANGEVAHITFENRVMRFNRKEYMLSDKTSLMLGEYLEK